MATPVSAVPLSGHVGNLTPEHEVALGEFRKLLLPTQVEMDEFTLLRFLRARKFDVVLANEMFQACEKWRFEKKVDSILLYVTDVFS